MWGILFLKTSEFRCNHLLSNYDISTNNWAIHNGNLTLKKLVIRTNRPIFIYFSYSCRRSTFQLLLTTSNWRNYQINSSTVILKDLFFYYWKYLYIFQQKLSISTFFLFFCPVIRELASKRFHLSNYLDTSNSK